jgi:hypothetical protein
LVAKVIVAVALPVTEGLSGLFAKKVIVAGVALLLDMTVAAKPAAERACQTDNKSMNPQSLCLIIPTMKPKLH